MLLINLLIGLGIFLFGMSRLERGIESLGSGWIKQHLAKSTRHRFQSVLSGTAITALVQSSSMVGLVILAFASAGVIPLYNAIGVLLGANLGTTFTGWVVTTLGFKLPLSAAALPAIGLGCLIQVFGESRAKLSASGALIFGLGLLLFGLGIMKDAVGDLPALLNMEQLSGLPVLVFLLLGTLLTAVIQSSSATMIIALTALYNGIIDLQSAAALVIGADLGTTSTMALGAIKGAAIKRQLALAHFLFNVVVDLLAFFILLPLLPTLLQWLNLKDPLYGLVAFHSTFNIVGIFLFAPFLPAYSGWIGQRFLGNKPSNHLEDVPITVPEAAITACQQQVRALLASGLDLNLRNLRLRTEQLNLSPEASALLNNVTVKGERFEQRYETLKQREGELLRYAVRLQQQPLDDDQASTLIRLLGCARDAVYAVKALKDIRPDLVELRHALTPPLQHFSEQYQSNLKLFYQQLLELLSGNHDCDYRHEQLQLMNQHNEQLHQQLHSEIQHHSHQGAIEPEQLSTLLNINRVVWHSGQNFLQALEHWDGPK